MVKHKKKKDNLKIILNKGKERLFFNGKLVKKSAIDKYNRATKLNDAKLRKKIQQNNTAASCSNVNVDDIPIEGEKIFNYKHMAKQMFCRYCNNQLHMIDAVGEAVHGLGSIFEMNCSRCKGTTKVDSSQKYQNPTTKGKLFSINTRSAIGALHCGFGATKSNKFFNLLGLPGLSPTTHKLHERIVGPVIEKVAKDSCVSAVTQEKKLTEYNVDKLKRCLPTELQENFLVTTVKGVDNEQDKKITRLLISYDMGWSQRSTGYKYDSLNGFASMIGYNTGKVLDFCTKNRKCRTCDVNIKKNRNKEHDCRSNHYGTAKSMEAEGAVQLVANSSILKEANAEVGVFIGENDSTCMHAIQEAVDHPVVKQADVNPSTKGVGNALYKLRENRNIDLEKELTHGKITNLKEIFSTIIKKNKFKKEAIENDLRNLSDHVFGDHENCGNFCKYITDKENYDNSRHLKNLHLKENVKKLFFSLADGAGKFVLAGSSQANESLNNIMASYCPKSHSYSTSESADYRYACAVANKNIGNSYPLKVLENLRIPYEQKIVNAYDNADKKSIKRLQRASAPSFKALRKYNKIRKEQLRNQKEKKSVDTYSSNIILLEVPSNSSDLIKECPTKFHYNTEDEVYFFWDLETGGVCPTKDVLQIAMKSENKLFSAYLTPSQAIDKRASAVTGLTCSGRQLFLNGEQVATVTPRIALLKVLEYLKEFGRKIVLIAHNHGFDYPRFIGLIQKYSMLDSFREVIDGFVDSLPLFRSKLPNRINHKLSNLAQEELQLSTENVHNALVDIDILENLATTYISWNDIRNSKISLKDALQRIKMHANEKKLSLSYPPMSPFLTKSLIAKLSGKGIDYNVFIDKFQEGSSNLKLFLTGGEDPFIKRANAMNNIFEFFNTIKNIFENGIEIYYAK